MLIFSAYNLFKGLFVILTIAFETANSNRLPDLSVISNLFNVFVKPYLKAWNLETTFRAQEEVEKSVEILIKKKLKQLQPFLQDDDLEESDTDNEITFQGNDETTIIEFVPEKVQSKLSLRHGNDTFKANMRRYKKVRNEIYEALDAELVSDKTKTLVMQTLDELLSKMVETQCQWKGGVQSTGNNVESRYSRFFVPKTIIKLWREEWQKFRATISNLARLGARKDNNVKDLLSYLTKLNSIINDLSVNLESFAKTYKIQCNVSERTVSNKKKLRQKKESFRLSPDSDIEKNMCKNFKVCSKELRTFFIDVYNSLNETSVNTLRSYAEMFTRDVNSDDSNEKTSIVEIILKIANQTQRDIIEIFANHTDKFQLDEHKAKDANMNLLSKYIKRITQHIKDHVGNTMFLKLNHLNKMVYTNIYQDVDMNLSIDLGNLERDLTSKICYIFNVCNGNRKTRRSGDSEVKGNSLGDENRIYVKVELAFDDERDLLKSNSSYKPELKFNENIVSSNVVDSLINKNVANSMKYENYANISVTRTTLSISTLNAKI